MKPALFWKPRADKTVQCNLCPRFCKIKPGQYGVCRSRKNVDGKLYSAVYGKLISYNVDPIEKKPFFHFAPGSQVFSFSTTGCNLRCAFCQNWNISMVPEPKGQDVNPEEIIRIAKGQGIQGIAYTYTEPTIFYEYALDTMKLARKEGMFNVWVSNGYTNPEPIRKASRYLDAVNVDMKGDMKFYQKLCGVPNEEPVRRALLEYKRRKVWIEVTNLIIPGHNDKPEQIKRLVTWVKKSLGVETPIHFTRFYPNYKLVNVSPTPVKTLERAYKIAKDMGIHWAYVGNVPGHKYESTYCWKCGELLVRRLGYELGKWYERCPTCGQKPLIEGRKWKGIVEA